MSKFKVGDRVRCVEDYPYQFTKGNEYVVRYYDADGDRLGVVSDDEGDENGLGAKYFEPVFTIQAGRYYKTRDGRKVKVTKHDESDTTYPFCHDSSDGREHWLTLDGKSCIGLSDDDLIAEWVDEPVAVAPATATFKAGDRVRLNCSEFSSAEAKYGTGTITGPAYNRRGKLDVAIDNYGGNLSYNDDELTLIADAVEEPATIKVGDWVRTDDGDIAIVLYDDGSDMLQFKVGFVGDNEENWDWRSDLQLTIVPPGTTKAANDNAPILAEIDELEQRLSELRAKLAA
ncbi:hypothetical protein ACWIGM_09035 [Bosea sp. NPDC055332]